MCPPPGGHMNNIPQQLADRENEFEASLMIRMSTGHLTRTENDKLIYLSTQPIFSSYILCYEYGILFRRLGEEELNELREADLTENAIGALRFALDNGFSMIEFDSDAYVIDSLQMHEW